jgi:hypothetical protein
LRPLVRSHPTRQGAIPENATMAISKFLAGVGCCCGDMLQVRLQTPTHRDACAPLTCLQNRLQCASTEHHAETDFFVPLREAPRRGLDLRPLSQPGPETDPPPSTGPTAIWQHGALARNVKAEAAPAGCRAPSDSRSRRRCDAAVGWGRRQEHLRGDGAFGEGGVDSSTMYQRVSTF